MSLAGAVIDLIDVLRREVIQLAEDESKPLHARESRLRRVEDSLARALDVVDRPNEPDDDRR